MNSGDKSEICHRYFFEGMLKVTICRGEKWFIGITKITYY
ncbi:hypothetical protein PJIAN_147 [Paludibacter jiangxiensis]|uniref:Uncharacterized protein n=1 Tax=Paludibacter jiangxiensis TaxID=681398 RepID=A0A170Y2U9_9BACT|nr:hypothetical protein PJIAN_147 [Paludibacter jiangxiensis]